MYCVERRAEPIKEDKGWQGLGHGGTSSQRVFPQNSPSNRVSLTSLHMEATLPLSLHETRFGKAVSSIPTKSEVRVKSSYSS